MFLHWLEFRPKLALHIEVFIQLGTNPLQITTHEITQATYQDVDFEFKGFGKPSKKGKSSSSSSSEESSSEDKKINKCFEKGVKNWFKNSIAVISTRLETTFSSLANPLLGLFNDATAFFDAILGN